MPPAPPSNSDSTFDSTSDSTSSATARATAGDLPEAKPAAFGIYVHVPWCATRCPYCAFNTYVEAAPPYGRWVEGILAQWRLERASFDGEAHSLYFGGGTPSLAPPEAVRTLIDRLPLARGAEVTLETNPGTITRSRLQDFKAAGVNRLSVGIQTFQPRMARLLNRGHTVEQSRELLQLVAEAGFESWSFDLIFSVPGQTEAEVTADLDAVIELAPPHVSIYGLSFEEGTPFTRARDEGRLVPVDEDRWRSAFDEIGDRLGAAGWERYEVSNFARPGHRSRHNEAVWRGGHYAGLGPGAHGFTPSGLRRLGHARFEDWIAAPEGEVEAPSLEQAATDLLLSTFRHIDGLPTDRLAERCGHTIDPQVIARLEREGLLHRAGAHLRPTPAAWPLIDGVVRRLADGLRPASRG